MLYEISEKAIQLENQGKKMIKFNLGDPDMPTPPEIIAAAYEAMKQGKTKYSSAAGEKKLREELASIHDVSADNVVITTGSKWAVFSLMFLLLKGGENVVALSPHWTSYELAAKKVGAELRFLRGDLESDWKIDVEKLEKLIDEKIEPFDYFYGNRLIADYNPEYIAVIFDAKGKSFRHDIYPKYKANRPIMPPDLQVQVKPLQELIEAMGLPLLVIEGVEADDAVIYYRKDGCTICSPDKDVLEQTPGRHYNYGGKENERWIQTSEEDADKFLWIQVMAGDSTDGVPGIEGIGPKKAETALKGVPREHWPLQTLSMYMAASRNVKEAIDKFNTELSHETK